MPQAPAAAAELGGERKIVAAAGVASFVEGRPAGLAPVTVAYERRGSGEPVVLLHGLGQERKAWDAVAPLLATEHEVIAVDLPGFGQSPDLPPDVPHDLSSVVAELGAVFTALGLERPHVVGHSLGGLIALRLAQAELARSVTALAPAGFWNTTERQYAFAVLAAARQIARLPEAVVLRLCETTPGRAALTGTVYGCPALCPPEALVACLRAMRGAVGFKATLRAGRAPGLFTGDIPDVPVTIAWGTVDHLLPGRQAARANAMIPGARLVWLPDCGHVPMNDAPELVARIILQATSPTAPAAGGTVHVPKPPTALSEVDNAPPA
ncbi:alpha/beta fold hydrolase [Sphaerisporangium viridialbum]|uniref:alpha/beta fold hydrolase n=1 Tax=Sphaerisporangium viridialbum TaxID=46189 RepID=UPI003C70B92E